MHHKASEFLPRDRQSRNIVAAGFLAGICAPASVEEGIRMEGFYTVLRRSALNFMSHARRFGVGNAIHGFRSGYASRNTLGAGLRF
jgi:hypothetical protein